MKKIRLIPVPPKEPKRLRVAAYCRVSTRSKEQRAILFRQICGIYESDIESSGLGICRNLL